MDTTFGGFRTRADATYKLLQAPGTASSWWWRPERDALREAAYFVERLAAEDMPFAGLVLNRVHGSGPPTSPPSGRSRPRRTSMPRPRKIFESRAVENLDDARIVDQEDGKARTS